jgi:hypothetical protein
MSRLKQAATTGGEVIDCTRGLEGEIVKVDDIDVGAHAWGKRASVSYSHHSSSFRCL